MADAPLNQKKQPRFQTRVVTPQIIEELEDCHVAITNVRRASDDIPWWIRWLPYLLWRRFVLGWLLRRYLMNPFATLLADVDMSGL